MESIENTGDGFTKAGVPANTWDIWSENTQLLKEKYPDLTKLRPVKSFQTFMEHTYGAESPQLERIMSRINKETVENIDALRESFNNNLPVIKKGSSDYAMDFCRDAYRTIMGVDKDEKLNF